ncbi:RuvC-like resolvase [Microbacterium phage ValentiniPuff]|uniref:RuvC-like resolvase n=1 Tax=Microbacterium phage ValentiniPuff TaxID=2315705 RepID=A0A386KPW7_9CAUD|nr:RuvC-like resolvase [Microbacterium phage ValentiniPuff]
MILVGLDVSLNGTGVARVDTDTGRSFTKTLDPKGLRSHARMEFVRTEVANVLRGADYAIVEALAFSAPSAVRDEIDGLHWQIRHLCWQRKVPYALVSPTALKSYVTGDGQAGKLEMVKAMRRAFPQMALSDRDDEADALGLVTMGARFKGLVLDAHVLRFPHALEKVQWADQDGEPRIIKKPRKSRSPLAR